MRSILGSVRSSHLANLFAGGDHRRIRLALFRHYRPENHLQAPGADDGQAFTPPSERPFIRYRWIVNVSTSTGRAMRVAAAVIPPQLTSLYDMKL